MGLDPDRLWATVHEGDPVLALGEDTVAIEAWKRVGMPAERIVRLGKDNFWQAAETGPCGQCSEIFFDRGERARLRRRRLRPRLRVRPLHGVLQPRLHGVRPAARRPSSCRSRTRTSTPGLGLERGACLLQGVDSVFDTDGFRLIMDWVEQRVGRRLRRQRRSRRRRTACSPTTAARCRS